MEMTSRDDLHPLVGRDGVTKKIKKTGRKHGVFLPVIVLISTLVTLFCIIFQLRMFFLYLDLKQMSRQNSLLIEQYINATTGGVTNLSQVVDNVQDAAALPQNQTRTKRDVDSEDTTDQNGTTGNTFPFYRFGKINGLDVGSFRVRNKRSDEADGNRRRPNSRNDDNGRARTSTRARPEVKVIHLELHKRHGSQLSVERGAVIGNWRASNAFHEQTFAKFEDTSLNINQRGVYLIYSQITYEDSYGRWSYSITINNRPFIKCLSTEWGIEKDPAGVPVTTYGQCHTAAVTHLSVSDTIQIKSMYRTDNIHTDVDLTFWGFVKLS